MSSRSDAHRPTPQCRHSVFLKSTYTVDSEFFVTSKAARYAIWLIAATIIATAIPMLRLPSVSKNNESILGEDKGPLVAAAFSPQCVGRTLPATPVV